MEKESKKKAVVKCIHCGHKIHQIGKRHRSVVHYNCKVGIWIHYPLKFRESEYFICPDGHTLAEPALESEV